MKTKTEKMWMMRGSSLATYYGIARTKKELIRRANQLGWSLNPTACKPVRVTVTSSAAPE
jgi:hypothetical protein